ncbi:MAG: hypothetical protein ABUL77_04230 [Bacteroidota bacterium]
MKMRRPWLCVAMLLLAACGSRSALSDGAVAAKDAGTGGRAVSPSPSRWGMVTPPAGNPGGKPGGKPGGNPGGSTGTTTPPRDAETARPVTRDLDLLFMIDTSKSMEPLQKKLAERLPDFMEVLKNLPGGLPDVHVAVISSALGAGIFGNVSGCFPGSPGNDGGKFQHAAGCSALPPDQTFIRSAGGVNNFTGDISDVFTCIALLGDSGCGFEHQFESTRQALRKAADAGDPDNGGFLRPNANLAIVMLTNEDDCSVSADSTLFDPSSLSVTDPSGLGGLQSYRCNEFGHLCGGRRPPHTLPASMTLEGCVAAEGKGRLTTVGEFVDFLRGIKPGQPDKVFVAAIAGPATPYAVEPGVFVLGDGSRETQPRVAHSCQQTTGEYADPGVRIKQWVDAFGANGTFQPICADDFKPALVAIAQAIAQKLVQ